MVSQIKKGALISYSSLLISILLGITYTPWMIKSIGVPDYGLYVLAMSVINFFVFDFGLGYSVQHFVSKYLAEDRLDKLNKFLIVIYKLFIILDIVIFFLLFSSYFFIFDIFQGFSPEESVKFKFIYAVVSIFSIFSFPFVHLDGTILAHGKFLHLKLCDLFFQIIVVSSMTFLLYFGYGLYAFVLVNVGAGICRVLFKLFVLKRHTKVSVNWGFWDSTILRSVISFSIWGTIYAISQRGVLTVAPFILGLYYNSEEIAILGIAFSLEGFFFLLANAINGLFLPKVSKLIVDRKSDEINKLMIRVGRVQIFLTGLIFIGLISFGRHFINIWVGEKFHIVYICSIILILPSFVSLAQNIGLTTIIAKGKVKYLAYSGILQALTNLILIFPFAKYYGVLGVSVSVAIAYSTSLFFNNLVYVKVLNLDVRGFFLSSFVKLFPLLIFTLFCGLLCNFVLSFQGWYGLILKVGIFTSLYISLFFIFGLSLQEREDFLGKVKIFRN
jgi:O-antigen/teichoic acid export membrane protein